MIVFFISPDVRDSESYLKKGNRYKYKITMLIKFFVAIFHLETLPINLKCLSPALSSMPHQWRSNTTSCDSPKTVPLADPVQASLVKETPQRLGVMFTVSKLADKFLIDTGY